MTTGNNRFRQLLLAGLPLVIGLLPLNETQAQTLPMDYSYCGYHRSEMPIPSVKNVVFVEPQAGDNSRLIQEALDYVGRQKPDKQTGLRGAVLLAPGTYELAEPLRMNANGVVLRGSGREATILRKTGTDRGALLYIEGRHDMVYKDTFDISGDVKAGSTTLPIASAFTATAAKNGAKGSQTAAKATRILIWRPSTAAWIESLGCASFGGGKRMGYWAWHPGDVDIRWHRTVTVQPSASGCNLLLDAPITTAIENKWGGGKVIVYEQPGLVSDCGVENLSMESAFSASRPKDEDHCWNGVYVADAEDCWVRMVTFRHFAGSAVIVQKSASQVTVEDCKSLQPISEIGGFRRRTFLTLGEKVLFQRCYSEQGINDFAAGHTAPGPNAFVQCESKESLGPSGSISSWAAGLLFDCVNIDGNDLIFKNLELEKFGGGWSTANSTLWQSTASAILCYSPDSTCRNYSVGCWGQIQGSGEYSEMNEHVKPYSIFQQQLLARLEKQAAGGLSADDIRAMCRVMERPTNASSSPTIEEAMQMSKEAMAPRVTMAMWIDSARFAGDINAGKLKPFVASEKKQTGSEVQSDYALTNGWLTFNGSVLVGGTHFTPWWSGRTLDSFLPQAKPALTRFVPGQEGIGLTDRVDSVVAYMERQHTLVFSQNYGLWYDRRRDDHERIRRKDGDVWAPFFEQPFARSGQETAWDGLSKYDLTKLNSWYFYRLRQFTGKTRTKGLLLKYQHYFQHNILEAGAHWVDCPWRTANNVNQTPFQEPVNFTGDKRIFTAELFYDISNPTLRALHRQYIRQQLDVFADDPNVIHSIGSEFTGPLHFVQFWLDVIAEWEQEHHRVLVALAVNKDVQDSILNDPVRSKVVDIIEIEQWFRHAKGEFAPPGGVNMAPRQYQRKIRTGSARFEDVYGEVSEYRERYPGKAVVYSAQKFPELCWASLMAGGSCAAVPITDGDFLQALTGMKPVAPAAEGICMLQGEEGLVVYKDTDQPLPFNTDGYRSIVKIDTRRGQMSPATVSQLSGKGVFWLRKK